MKAVGFLLMLVAIWLIINAVNIREVMQGKAKFNFNQSPDSKIGRVASDFIPKKDPLLIAKGRA